MSPNFREVKRNRENSLGTTGIASYGYVAPRAKTIIYHHWNHRQASAPRNLHETKKGPFNFASKRFSRCSLHWKTIVPNLLKIFFWRLLHGHTGALKGKNKELNAEAGSEGGFRWNPSKCVCSM